MFVSVSPQRISSTCAWLARDTDTHGALDLRPFFLTYEGGSVKATDIIYCLRTHAKNTFPHLHLGVLRSTDAAIRPVKEE